MAPRDYNPIVLPTISFMTGEARTGSYPGAPEGKNTEQMDLFEIEGTI